MSLDSFPENLRALVIGSSGGIGVAFVRALQGTSAKVRVEQLHRHSSPLIDFADKKSIHLAAQSMAGRGPFHLIINATGMLHNSHLMPEKNWLIYSMNS